MTALTVQLFTDAFAELVACALAEPFVGLETIGRGELAPATARA